ncbi:hypothetical protein MF133_22665 [Aeromonas caviae]|uniref:hypothetical protein n=1 Tax=Aeromonas caviae TaxID=648 RepID=UPI001EEF7DA3|nr:hypothetical protein [Aeromonas caviae]ULH02861.1 hypothetical protein MF133_22665 [Aeromonas caviae]
MWLLALLQLAWLGWLLTFPVALDSDDALNFAHGVVRFSVLEFSPLSGLPCLYLAGAVDQSGGGRSGPRGAVGKPLGSSLLAPLAAFLAARLWQRPSLLAPVWLLVLALPLTPTLALSGLSDGPALAAWLGALLALLHRKAALAGMLLGLMLALRPPTSCWPCCPFGWGWRKRVSDLTFCSPLFWWG